MRWLSLFREFFDFLFERKKWWLIPIVFFLLVLGVVVFFSQGTVIAPFIYTIF